MRAGIALNPWVRRLHLVMLVGGGFMSAALTAGYAIDGKVQGGLNCAIAVFACCTFCYMVFAGIAASESPQGLVYALVAYLIQVPYLSSPVLTYRNGAGPALNFAVIGDDVVVRWHVGTSWYIGILRTNPWGIGLNVVALAMAILVARQMADWFRAQRAAVVNQEPN